MNIFDGIKPEQTCLDFLPWPLDKTGSGVRALDEDLLVLRRNTGDYYAPFIIQSHLIFFIIEKISHMKLHINSN